MTAVLWFRRDLRLEDHPALVEAARAGDVLPLFVVDPNLWDVAGANRRWFLSGCLRNLHDQTDGALVVRHGRPTDVVAAVAREAGAGRVVVTADHGPYGRARDAAVEEGLAEVGVDFARVSSSYAVEPGSVRKDDGGPYAVFTPFHRRWREHGWDEPVDRPARVRWLPPGAVASDGLPTVAHVDADLPEPGEHAAHLALGRFIDGAIDAYDELRDLPAEDATSRLSAYLKWGCLHPRQVLDRLQRSNGAQAFARQLAWREFYADVLWHRPATARETMQASMQAMAWSTGTSADDDFERWAEGRTGYPIVDAGMRQLIGEGWMHNRVRLIVGSFLVKDLHIDWRRGARHFMEHLVDGDLASNQHNWQWVAGTGTDPSPFFRVFNPVSQGKRFDPDGAYITRWVPELRGLPVKEIHEPWTGDAERPPTGYPDRIVDHAEEREEALRRYRAARGG